MPYSAHCVWTTDVDSREMGKGFVDEGDMFMLPNGDEIEVGFMENPDTGREEIYKEYWAEAPGADGSGGGGKSPCVVAEAGMGEGSGRKGRMVRIGDFCQGVVDGGEGEGVVAMRSLKKDGKWVNDGRSKEGPFPCTWVCEDGRKVGDVTECDGMEWEITELVT